MRQLLAFPAYAIAAWRVWVLAQQTAPSEMAVALGGMVLIGLMAWLWQPTRTAAGRGRVLGGIGVAVGIAVLWSGLRAEGRPVFVNFTAGWCTTWLVNERTALRSEKVRRAMQARDIAYLRGDWTRRDPEITRTLERFGRSGVPLHLLYSAGDGGGEPQVPPPLPTEGLLLERLD